MFLSVAEMAELLKHVLAQRDVLQAVVDQLDTTKDGVPIVPGMLLYRVLYGRVDEHEACLAVDTGDYSDPSYYLLSGDEYYSTAELAKLAEAGRSHD